MATIIGVPREKLPQKHPLNQGSYGTMFRKNASLKPAFKFETVVSTVANYREQYSGKTVLVTGGAGAIGSNLCRELADLGARVLILDDLSSGALWNVPLRSDVVFVE